jgi:membrane-associated protease RseP (regulator of RpoE activity)
MSDDLQSPVEQAAEKLSAAVSDLFAVSDVTLGIPRQPDVIRLRGRLQVPSHRAYRQIAARFRELGYTPMLRRDPQQDLDVLLATPGVLPEKDTSRTWINVVLYVLTILSTLYVGASWSDQMPQNLDQTQMLLWPLTHLWLGWPFALSLMTILTGHELGHYFAGRHYKVPVSLPYFIPFPLPPLGTMGAFIQMKGQAADRRQMLAIGVAGPLTGLILAVPILILGLSMSHVEPLKLPPPGMSTFLEGNSILYLVLKFAVFGKILPGSGLPPETLATALREGAAALFGAFPIDRGLDVIISPVALAGWAGILVTALNLLPVGQLDGGHVLYSLVGNKARLLTWPIIGLCLVMGFLFWEGWFLWAGLLFLFGQGHPDPLDDITRLSIKGKVVAVIMLLIFVLTFTPLPMRIFVNDVSGQPVGCLAVVGIVAGAIWLAWRAKKRLPGSNGI